MPWCSGISPAGALVLSHLPTCPLSLRASQASTAHAKASRTGFRGRAHWRHGEKQRSQQAPDARKSAQLFRFQTTKSQASAASFTCKQRGIVYQDSFLKEIIFHVLCFTVRAQGKRKVPGFRQAVSYPTRGGGGSRFSAWLYVRVEQCLGWIFQKRRYGD